MVMFHFTYLYLFQNASQEPYAFVEFGDHAMAQQALNIMDKRVLLGKVNKVIIVEGKVTVLIFFV